MDELVDWLMSILSLMRNEEICDDSLDMVEGQLENLRVSQKVSCGFMQCLEGSGFVLSAFRTSEFHRNSYSLSLRKTHLFTFFS